MEGWFGVKHLTGLATMILLSIIFFVVMHFFVNKHAKGRIWALRGLCLFLIFIEIVKYIMILRGDGQTAGSIGHGNFPFQLCSMPLYLFPFVSFGKSKFSNFLKPASFCIGLLAGLITLLYPSNVLFPNQGWFVNGGLNFPLISFVYHTIMIDFAIYMLISKNYKMKAKDAFIALAVMFSLATVAIVLNLIIPGADYFMLGKGYGNPLSFIIPKAGLFAYIASMVAVASMVVMLMYSYHLIKYLINHKKAKTIKK